MALTLAAPTAAAQVLRPEVRAEPLRFNTRIEALAGFSAGQLGGFLGGASVHVSHGYFQVGAIIQGGNGISLFGGTAPSLYSLGGTVGVRLQTSPSQPRVRFDILLTGGVRGYYGIGSLSGYGGSGSSGVDGTLGFIGGRLGIAHESASAMRFTIGAAFYYEVDIGRVSAIRETLPGGGDVVGIGGYLTGVVLTIGVVIPSGGP